MRKRSGNEPRLVPPLQHTRRDGEPRKRDEATIAPGNARSSRSGATLSRLAPAVPTEVYDTYWRFAAERQAIFFRRFEGEAPPWSGDAILREHKFTNAYRASDRVSQYLVRHVIYSGEHAPDEVFFRVILFKLFNRIETWERLKADVGEIRYAEYDLRRYDAVLTKALSRGEPIYSAAYIMPSDPHSKTRRKHRFHLWLVHRMMKDHLPLRVADCRSMPEVFELLRSYSSIGDFLAYQYAIDLNYTTLLSFSENDFVVPGPGAKDGIRKCFRSLGGLNEAEVIRLMVDRQHVEFERLGLSFQNLFGRSLTLIDCQNLFCEVSKYARIFHPHVRGLSGRTRIKQRYKPTLDPLPYWYPPKWGLNERAAESFRTQRRTSAH